MRKNQYKKKNLFEISLLLSILGSMCIYFFYKQFLLFYFYVRYDDAFFVYNSNYYLIIIFCVYIVFCVSYYFSNERKMCSKKFWQIFLSIGLIILFLTFSFNSKVWVATERNISYNTLFIDEKICYEYSDLESATLYYNESVGIKMRGVSPEYTLHMNDGQNITLCLFEGYYDSYEDLIEFDKRIANKRRTRGKFISLHIPEEINTYYQKVFENQLSKKVLK